MSRLDTYSVRARRPSDAALRPDQVQLPRESRLDHPPPEFLAAHEARIRAHQERVHADLAVQGERSLAREAVEIAGRSIRVFRRGGQWWWRLRYERQRHGPYANRGTAISEAGRTLRRTPHGRATCA
jgi:hypothetical protein